MRSNTSLLAVIMMMGVRLVSRILAHTAQPSITGSMISSSTMSGSMARNMSTAAPPSNTAWTSNPSFSKYIRIRSEML